MTFAVRSTLTSADIALDASKAEAIKVWVEAIYRFVADRANGGTSAPAPQTLQVSVDLPATALRDDQLFELETALVLERDPALVAPGLKGVDSVRASVGSIAPMSGDLTSNTGADAATPTSRKLEAFAQSFEKALSTDKVLRKVAVGADRANVTGADASHTLWSVSLGKSYGDAISYKVDNPGQPSIFAPRPLSNKLKSHSDVPIYDYKTGEGIDFTKPSRTLSFTDIDLDVWARAFVGAVDQMLTAPYVVPAQILDDHNDTSLLDDLLSHKKTLAGAFKHLMVPVYKGETADPTHAQDAFEQQMLEALSNAYSVRAAAQFDADVTAKIPQGPYTDTPPRLYGEVVDTSSDNETCG